MNALPKLAEWSKDLLDWLSDLARRAVLKGTLDAADLDAVEALLLSWVGIPDAENRSAVRLTEEMISSPVDSTDEMRLLAIREPRFVNALDENATLAFGTKGLTVIWGPNGAGKSGFVRILKNACRSRDQEPVLPNVFATGAPGPAQAALDWQNAADSKSEVWTDGQAKIGDLSKVAIFDGRCARIFIDDEQEVTIVLYGVDVLREMARCCQEIKRRLEIKQRENLVDFNLFDSLRGQTEVGRYINTLGAGSSKQTATDLANLCKGDAAELKSLSEQLAEDPVKKAQALRRQVQRYKQFVTELQTASGKLSVAKIDALRDSMLAYKRADEISSVASAELAEKGTVLPGTGEDPWRELMVYAMKYAEKAYSGQEYPAEIADARCVLCQQPLEDEAKERLNRFVRFLQDEAQKKRDACRKATGVLFKAFEELDLSALPADPTILDEIEEIKPGLKAQYTEDRDGLKSRRNHLIEKAKERDIPTFDPLPVDIAEAVGEICRNLENQAINFEKAAQTESRKIMVARHAELLTRSRLKDLLPTVLKSIDALGLKAKLENAIKQTGTTAITRKSTELTDAAISSGLNTMLDHELKNFRIVGLKLEIGLRGQKGQGMQQLRLDMARASGKAKVSDILSEGEQRAIAIACFLAECKLVSAKNAIVFDDPVSSVDHIRRELIANRLASEAKARQVIVFTHDLCFAWDLTEAAKATSVPIHACRIYPTSNTKGNVAEGLPHEGGKILARLNDLDVVVAKAKKALEDKNHEQYDLLIRNGYRRLRDAWERLIEECLFGDAVRRFRNSVQTQRLRFAEVEDQDAIAVNQGMTRCSMFTHDAPMETAPDLPTPDVFADDIDHLRKTFVRIDARMKVTEQRRKQAGA
jgi:energy-coupling factor transporter ATP-binding protein EcfA2